VLRKFLIAGVAVVATAAIAGGVLLSIRDGDRQPTGTPTAADGPTGTVDTRTGQQRAEDTFIIATAAHLCTVQSTVYDDPKAMADAYQATSPYPGLDKAQVRQLQQRLTVDPGLAARLSTRLRDACKPSPPR
jgi:hypothetical protein